MTEARVEPIEPDPWLAAAFLLQAKGFSADGSADGSIGMESRQVLLHSAVIAACDALLAINGRQIAGTEGGHIKRLAEAQRLLPGDHDELFDALDDGRVARNSVSYAAGLAMAPDVDETAKAVQQLLALIDAQVSPRLPDWHADS